MMDSSFLKKKSYEKLNTNFFCSYNIILSLFNQFGLIIEYNKLEVFHFSRLTKNIHPPLLNLKLLESLLLYLKNIWRYLDFFFDKKLYFQHHVHHYTNKALSIIKDMKILGNSNRELSSIYKWLLYITYILSIALYRFQLWYFKGVLLFQLLKELKINTKKSGLIDHRNIQNLTYLGYWGNS